MTKKELINNIRRKKSFLCVGLDTDIEKIPSHLHGLKDPIFEFNKSIIDATAPLCVAYKPNLAFYESAGQTGMKSLEKSISYIRNNYPDQFIIADAKRGDIGNTSQRYARAFFSGMDVDAVTVAPYMGHDSVKPFTGYQGKWVILLALTSNKGADDFQLIKIDKEKYLFESVLEKSKQWGNPDNMMYVVGATQASLLKRVRAIVPDSFLLVPGVGAQGGSLQEVCHYGMNSDCGLLINSSRNIIYADSSENFAAAAKEKAMETQSEMAMLLK